MAAVHASAVKTELRVCLSAAAARAALSVRERITVTELFTPASRALESGTEEVQLSGLISCTYTEYITIERLWRDVWNSVTSIYYDLLHCLEEEGVLDLAYSVHLFSVQYVFIPRIQDDLDFRAGWNDRSLHTEHSLTPNQLREMGLLQSPDDRPDSVEDFNYLPLEDTDVDQIGIQVPELVCPLEMLRELLDPVAHSACFGEDVYRAVVQYVEGVTESRC